MKIERSDERRFSSTLPEIAEIINEITRISEERLPEYLRSIREWRHPKTDLFYWIQILNMFDEILERISSKYELRTLQTQRMTEKEIELAREIIRFIRLLVENSSNKSIFNSFEVIEGYVYCYELELSIESLYLLSFYASKIHIQRTIKGSMSSINIGNIKMLTEKISSGIRSLTYYDEVERKTKKVSIKKAVKKGIQMVSAKSVPKTETKRLAHYLRTAISKEEHQKESLRIIRLLALSTMIYYKHIELSIDTEFISKDVVEVLGIINTEGYRIKEAALCMLDALFRMRIRHASVVSLMNLHLYDGMIMTLLRRTIEEEMPEPFLCAFYNFLSSIFASTAGASALCSAGVVQYICMTLSERTDISFRKKGRLVAGTNTFLFTIPTTFPRFLAENGMGILAKELLKGVNAIVSGRISLGTPTTETHTTERHMKIDKESDSILDKTIDNNTDNRIDTTLSIELTEDTRYELLVYIKLILKITSQLFLNVGTPEAIRGFLEGEFPIAIRTILNQAEIFNPIIMSHLFSILTQYIHAEPANLPFIIEADIFEGFIRAMKQEMPPIIEYLIEVPEIIEAFLLNPELLKRLESEGVIGKLFDCFLSVDLCDTITMYQVSTTFGMFFEVFLRHHPAVMAFFKEKLYSTMKSLEKLVTGMNDKLAQTMISNLMRMVSVALDNDVNIRTMLTDKGLLNNRMISLLIMVDISWEEEPYSRVTSILRAVFAEQQTFVLMYILKVLNKAAQKRTEDSVSKIRRVLLIVNILLHKNETASNGFIKFCKLKLLKNTLTKILSFAQAFIDAPIEITSHPNTNPHVYLQTLCYAFTKGLLKQCSLAPEAKKHYPWVFINIASIAIENIENYNLDHCEYLFIHLDAMKGYIGIRSMKNTDLIKKLETSLLEMNLGKMLERHAENIVGLINEFIKYHEDSDSTDEKDSKRNNTPNTPNAPNTPNITPDKQKTTMLNMPGSLKASKGEDSFIFSNLTHSPGMPVLREYGKNIIINPGTIPHPSVFSKTISSILSLLSMLIAEIDEFMQPNKKRKDALRIEELEKSTVRIIELLSPGIGSLLIEYPIAIAEKAYLLGPYKQEQIEQVQNIQGQHNETAILRERLKGLVTNLLVNISNTESGVHITSEILTVLLRDRPALEEIFNRHAYSIVKWVMIREYDAFEYVRNRLPEIVSEIGNSKTLSLLQLFSSGIILAQEMDALKGTDYISQLSQEITFAPTRLGDLLEAQLEVALAVSKVQLERTERLSLRITNINELIERVYRHTSTAETNRRAIHTTLNLLLIRLTESTESLDEIVQGYIKGKYYDKTKPCTVSSLYENTMNAIYYSFKGFLTYLDANFDITPEGLLVHRPPEKWETKEETKEEKSPETIEEAVSVFPEGIFIKKIRKYTKIDSSIFRMLLSIDTSEMNILEKVARTHSIALLAFTFPQVINDLTTEEYPLIAQFIEKHIAAKRSRALQVEKNEKDEEDFYAYWTGYILTVIFTYSNSTNIKRHLVDVLGQLVTGPVEDLLVVTELLQRIVLARLCKNAFDENLRMLKEKNILTKILERLVEIDQHTKGYTIIVQKMSRVLEYLSRICSIEDKVAFYEEPRSIEDESSDESDGAHMEDFDTDETIDSSQTHYESEEDQSTEVGISYSTEESTEYTEDGESLFTEQRYFMQEEKNDKETDHPEDIAPQEFLKTLTVHSFSKMMSDEMKMFIDQNTFLQLLAEEYFVSRVQALPRKDFFSAGPSSPEGIEDISYSQSQTEEDSETHTSEDYEIYRVSEDSTSESNSEEVFALDEEIVLGDENGDIPELDVDVLNSLPMDILIDTISQFYRERLASTTEYRPINLHFLNSLTHDARNVFEEEEANYFNAFTSQRPPREEKKKYTIKEEHFSQIRDISEIIPKRLATYLVRMSLQCTSRKSVLMVLNNLASNKETRVHIVRELMNTISCHTQTGTPASPSSNMFVKRIIESLLYFCTKSDDFIHLFCEDPSMFNDILSAITRKNFSEMLKLLSILSICYSTRRITTPEKVNIHMLLRIFEYEIQEEVFEYINTFIRASASYYRSEYLEYFITKAYSTIEQLDKTKEKLSSTETQKKLQSLIKLLTLISTVKVSEEYIQKANTLRLAPFWKEFFTQIQLKEKSMHFIATLLPLFRSFILAYNLVRCSHETDSLETQETESTDTEQKIEYVPIPNEEFYNSVIEREKETFNAFISMEPELLFKSFAGLPPRILDFDNKRIYFYKKIQSTWTHRNTLTITVNRETVFEDTFHQLMGVSGKEIRNAKINIKFAGEEGMDAGGLTREWFSELSKEMFNPNYALFTPISTAYHPNPNSHINPEHLMYFKFIGRIIGKGVHDEIVLDCYFTRSFYKSILNISTDLSDIELIEPEFHRSLKWILDNPIENILDLTFSIEIERFGITEIVDLKPNGRYTPVTESNKKEYVDLVCKFKLTHLVEKQLDAFIEGFFEILDPKLVQIFNEKELELLISGLPEIDIDDWKNNTVYHGYTSTSQVIRWFWRALRNFSMEERAKLLQFSTGTSKLPLEGFSGLKGQNGIQKFQIHRAPGSDDRLPTAHTCFNQLDLPEYKDYNQLVKLLLYSTAECSSGFGFA
ncbi:E3 ubiquitin-protein ligase HUWE1 [Nematocida sp. AWRm80]|nr:E3 ubiquitin-protein ligase HUWE1 [Nematocida sp. AWRm80]